MIDTVEKNQCFGCYACYNICPTKCISMKLDEEGFRFPKIYEDACIKCRKCDEVCPARKERQNTTTDFEPIAYACYNKNDEIRRRSATGGIFFTLANYIIKNNGVVFGVVGNLLDRVYHTMGTTLDDIIKMCNSKYLQSDVNNTFAQAKEQLEMGKFVLYSGTPCQIAGFYGYLDKQYDNLYTVDLICHGVPSEIAFHKYIDELEKKKKSKVIKIYRDKTPGWRPVHFTYVFENGLKETYSGANNIYNRGFTTNLFQRLCCYSCKYYNVPRIADLSLGDYFLKQLVHDQGNQGLAVVIVNTKKGETLFDSIIPEIFHHVYPLEQAIKENEHLSHAPLANKNRDKFFKLIRKKSFSRVTSKFLPSVHLRNCKFLTMRAVRKINFEYRKLLEKVYK